MITLLTSTTDIVASQVCRILDRRAVKYLRVNCDSLFNNPKAEVQFEYADFELNWIVNGQAIPRSENDIIWFHRMYSRPMELYSKEIAAGSSKELISFHSTEFSDFVEHISDMYKSQWSLGNSDQTDINKMSTLKIAKEIGLEVPKSWILSHTKELAKVLSKTELICKPLAGSSVRIKAGDTTLQPITRVVENQFLTEDFSFYPSLFQEKIDKQYEIRCFYLDGRTYSVAILSQNNQKTEVDFRNYDSELPNRLVPYELPKEVEAKLKRLMEHVGHNFGFVDFIRASDGTYVFLEVNPEGLPNGIPEFGRHRIDVLIANLLIERDEKRKKENQTELFRAE